MQTARKGDHDRARPRQERKAEEEAGDQRVCHRLDPRKRAETRKIKKLSRNKARTDETKKDECKDTIAKQTKISNPRRMVRTK